MQKSVAHTRTQLPSVTRREEYSQATKEALISAAREHFTKIGYQETSVEAIANSARVTRGAFYHHFLDKRALFEAVVLALQAQASARIIEDSRLKPELVDRIKSGVRTYLAICCEAPYRRIVIQEAPAVLDIGRCREIADANVMGLFVGALGELRKSGQFDFGDTHLAGHMIGAMICEASLVLTQSSSEADVRRNAEQLIERVLAAFRAIHNPSPKTRTTTK